MIEELKKGKELSFYIYSDRSGNSESLKFFKRLKRKRINDFKKLMRLIKKSSDNSNLLFKNDQKFKNVEGKICEIKSHQVRIWCIRIQSKMLLLMGGYLKKDQKIPRQELEKIRNLVKKLEKEGIIK